MTWGELWEKWGWEIIALGSVSVILIAIWVNRGKRGTWSANRVLPNTIFKFASRRISTSQSEVNSTLGPNQNRTSSQTMNSPFAAATIDRNISRGEAECKRVLETIYGKPFKKIRPPWLANPVTGGTPLELDCYNEELKLAVEYNGQQHSKYSPFFHRNKEAFLNQKYRDHMKAEMCAQNGVTLIVVPNTIALHDIESYIRNRLTTLGK
jgi:hypothetical protein